MADARAPRSARRSLATAALCAVLLANFAFGLTAARKRADAFRLAPGATVSDLYYRWLGTRLLLLDGINPYAPDAVRAGTRGFYGRALNEREKSLDVENYQGFNYPLHVAVLLAPFSLLPFTLVQVIAVVALAALIVWVTAAWCRALGWPSTPQGRAMVCFAAATSAPTLDLVSLQQPSGFVLGLLVFAVLSVSNNRRLAAAGVCVACATIKPQLVALPVAVMLCWSLARPRRRWPFLAGLGAALAVLLGASLALLPAWPAWFLADVRGYASQVPPMSLLARLPLWPWRAVVEALVVGVTVGTLWVRGAAREGAEHLLLDVFALSLAATLIVSLADHVYDRVLLIPPLLSLVRLHRARGTARISAPRPFARLVVAILAIVLAMLALLTVLVYVPGDAAPQMLVRIPFLAYYALPLLVWTALLVAVLRAGSSTDAGTRRATVAQA